MTGRPRAFPLPTDTAVRFDEADKARLLALKGVGPTVVQRLEEIGFTCLADIAGVEPQAINKAVSQMLHASCWANSPMARAAMARVVDLANERHPGHGR